MIGLICIYFIGKYFYNLANAYNRNKWLYGLLGVLCFYYGSLFIGGIAMYFFAGTFWHSGVDFLMSFPNLGVLKMPFGILLACGVHYVFETNWKKSFRINNDEIDSIGKE